MSPQLDGVRDELRRLGYLDHGFGRFLLQDALKPQRPVRTVLELTLKVGVAAGIVLALVLTFSLAAANGILSGNAFDLFPLFCHLLIPTVALVAVVFLVFCGAIVVLLQAFHARRVEVVSLAAAWVAGLALVGFAVGNLAQHWAFSTGLLVLLILAAVAITVVLVRLLEGGLLGLAILLTDQAPRHRFLFSRRWLVGALAVGVGAISLAALVGGRSPVEEEPSHLPSRPGGRALMVGVDGVLAQEADYLLSRGDLPALEALLDDGGAWLRYPHRSGAPATFWATLATGLPEAAHGVSSLDSFLPWGMTTALARNGPVRPYWRHFAVPLGLARYLPLLSAERKAPTVWELTSRGGAPVVAVNWWATFPAVPLPGLVVSHGAYQLLAEGAPGAVASSTQPEWVAATVARARASSESSNEAALSGFGPGFGLGSGLGSGSGLGAAVLERAVKPDLFYLNTFREALRTPPKLAALYLPGLDLAADGWLGGDLPFADLARFLLQAMDETVGQSAPAFDTIVVVLDPGRRGGQEGRVLLWTRGGCGDARLKEHRATDPSPALAGAPSDESAAPEALPHVLPERLPEVLPEALPSALLRTVGLPQSLELPEPPALCQWPVAPHVVPTYGHRLQAAGAPAADEEYLKSLRSLGYL